MSEGTVVLIHGLWLTSTGWDRWAERYQQRGYNVLAPAWPGMDLDVEVLRKDPSVLDGLGVREVADHYDAIVRGLDEPPVLIGHSFGGLIVQMLLDRGLGAAGIALHPAPFRGVRRLPPSALRASLPVLRSPASRHGTVALTFDQWRYAFTTTWSAAEAVAAYDRYCVPAPGRPLWQAATANLSRHAATYVDTTNDARAPLLLVGSRADTTAPFSLVREAHARYHGSSAVTVLKEYPGRAHFTMAQDHWEPIADDVLDWSANHRS